ncbi:MAG: glycosyltransferase family 4 protein [Candidatus Latescibacteria bacterium]|nr:glycosyltransferase family 4 protein [Candidatus Latescibacterota bacterium]
MNQSGTIVYILGSFPTLSETFILREVVGLRRKGLPVTVVALNRGHQEGLSPEERVCMRDARFVPSLFFPTVLWATLVAFLTSPRRYAKAFRRMMGQPHQSLYCYLRALYHVLAVGAIVRRLSNGPPVVHVHGHFASLSTEVAMGVAAFLDVPFSFTAHAKDIDMSANTLPEKMRAAQFVVTCTDYNARYLQTVCPDLHPEHVVVVRQGVPLDEIEWTPSRPSSPPLILSVGRLVEKKGHHHLIDACAMLRGADIPFRCLIIGDGPLRQSLSTMIVKKGLWDRITLEGSRPYRQLMECYRRATVFVLPSLITESGDREGVPNVLVEAMAFGVPVVATPTSGIPELVMDGETGLLVPPGDARGLAVAMARLIRNDDLRRRLSTAGRWKVEAEYDIEHNIVPLMALFETCLPLWPLSAFQSV